MKSNYSYISVIVLSCLFCACQNGTIENKVETMDMPTQEAALENDSIFSEVKPGNSSSLSNACEKLQSEYTLLIEKINDNKEDKQLISQLIEWTKKPSHLNCLNSDLVYNAQIEKLNETL